MKGRVEAISVFLGLLVLLGLGVWDHSRDLVDETKPLNALQERTIEWNERFDALGKEGAYAAFLEEGNAIGYMGAHDLSHIIGEVLYRRYGDQGVMTCTDDFAFGCYHGFAGTHMSEKGLGSVVDLQQMCRNTSNYLGCEHGIGHAILAFLGDQELVRALRACPEGAESVGGCAGGVFMEFNYHTMQSVNGIDPRRYDEKNPYAPCDSVPEAYVDACYYELPPWWRITLEEGTKGIPSKEYPILGVRCAPLSEPHKSTCYRGIGNMIGPRSEYNAGTMEEWCGMLPPGGVALCYREAVGHLLQSEEGKEDLRLLCASGKIVAENLCKGPALHDSSKTLDRTLRE